MDISVYRPGDGHVVLSSAAVIASCQTQDALAMVEWTMETCAFGLVALDGVQTIVKPSEPGDSRFTFEDLLDDCHSSDDLAKSQERELLGQQLEMIDGLIDKLQPVKPLTIRLAVRIDKLVHIDLVLKGRSVLNAEDLVTRLFMDDTKFREDFRNAVHEQLIRDDTDYKLGIVHQPQPVPPPKLPEGVEWEISNT